ncbi:MAG: type II 3-dehydroquinate dehydratase [Clostridia bacterium]|nr:type II 3-dehydroquinate dehydratase [Clostridia bacterium]
MKFLIINGPNLNMLGIREPGIYGNGTYEELKMRITDHSVTVGVEVEIFQSNHEGVLVDKLQEAYFKKIDGIVINPAAYTHTSVALLDALKSIAIPTVEVHISKVEEREDFRQISYVRQAVIKTITGKGFDGYLEAIDYLKDYIEKNERKATKI